MQAGAEGTQLPAGRAYQACMHVSDSTDAGRRQVHARRLLIHKANGAVLAMSANETWFNFNILRSMDASSGLLHSLLAYHVCEARRMKILVCCLQCMLYPMCSDLYAWCLLIGHWLRTGLLLCEVAASPRAIIRDTR